MRHSGQPQPELGSAIRQLREKRGETQESLATRASTTLSTLSLIERGLANPTWSTVRSIAEALGVSMGELGKLTDKPDD